MNDTIKYNDDVGVWDSVDTDNPKVAKIINYWNQETVEKIKTLDYVITTVTHSDFSLFNSVTEIKKWHLDIQNLGIKKGLEYENLLDEMPEFKKMELDFVRDFTINVEFRYETCTVNVLTNTDTVSVTITD